MYSIRLTIIIHTIGREFTFVVDRDCSENGGYGLALFAHPIFSIGNARGFDGIVLGLPFLATETASAHCSLDLLVRALLSTTEAVTYIKPRTV